jgi:ribose transport system substrate-binding protein
MKRVLWLATVLIPIALVVGLLVTTTASSAPAQQKTVRIAFIGPVINGFTNVIADGVKDAAKKYGGKVTVYDPGFDASKQYNQVQDAIALNKFDAFVIIPLDAASLIPIVGEAGRQGIKVIAANSPVGPDLAKTKPQVPGTTATVMEDQKNTQAKAYAQLTAMGCKGINPCKYIYISGAPAISLEKILIGFMSKYLKQQKNVKLVAIGDGKGYSESGAFAAAQDLLQAHPDVNVIGTSGDQMALGVALAVQQAGKAGQVKIFGAGASCRGLKALKQGKIFGTTLRVPRTDGFLAGKAAIDAVRGKKVQAWQAGSRVTKQGVVITKATLRPDFKCQWVGS